MSHASLVLLVVLHQLTGSIGLERTEQGNTFLTVAFGGQIWNIQYARPVVNRKVKAFHHTALNQSVHEEIIPASLLCQQIALKLATAFSFQFQKRAFFLVLRGVDEHITQIVMLCVFVVSVVLMEHIVDIELQYIFDNVLDIQRGETDTHIVEQQEHGSVGIEFLNGFHELVLHIVRKRYLARFNTVQMFTADTSHDSKPCLGHAVRLAFLFQGSYKGAFIQPAYPQS